MLRTKYLCALLLLAGCNRGYDFGSTPEMSPRRAGLEHTAMMTPTSLALREENGITGPAVSASLWTGERGSLLGERRAIERGDILTVVIEIDEGASISNSSDRSRDASQSVSMPSLFGIPQRVDGSLPEGASMANAVDLGSQSSASGSGSVKRTEKLELRVAATVIDVLPNSVLSIEGTQEVRVNYEMRELIVTGFVRPQDISRKNEVTYDKIASARISYGGTGAISEMQQPRVGQQILENILPF